ncbi:MAG TPA: hypothetical protein VF678_06655 [bacterium]
MTGNLATTLLRRRRLLAHLCLLVAAFTFIVTPVYASNANDLDHDGVPDVAFSAAVVPGFNPGSSYARTSEDCEERISLAGEREADPDTESQATLAEQHGRVAVLTGYTRGAYSVEVRSRLVTAAVYLCLPQRFP